MALKAGRVGVHPSDVDPISGHISPSSTEGYTKSEADDKFETKTDAASTYETKADASNLQPKTLAVPIEMLSGSKLDVESALQGLNSEKITYADNGILGAKNLLPYPYQAGSSYTANGITHTVNSDGSIELNGTATADTDFCLFTGAFPKGNYILSQKNTNSLSGIIIEAYNGTTYVKGIIDSSSFSIDNKSFSIDYSGYNTIIVTIRTKNTAVLSNFTIYPMIRLASDSDDTYAPYAMTNREITEQLTMQESAVTDISAGVVSAVNKLKKVGKIVSLTFNTESSSYTADEVVFKIPSGYRPINDERFVIWSNGADLLKVRSNGDVAFTASKSNTYIFITVTWVTA